MESKIKLCFANLIVMSFFLSCQAAFGEEDECFHDGSISILSISPSSSMSLKGFTVYTFAVTVEYNFNNLTAGVIGIRAFDPYSWENLDDQSHNDLEVSSQTGVATVYITARMAKDTAMIEHAGISVLLIDEVLDGACTAVSDEITFSVDNTNVPEQGDINNDKTIDLKDLVSCLQIVSGKYDVISDERADIDKNYKLGIENAIYLLDLLKE